jgi:alcohol dehydrogenase class IV
MTSPVSTGYDFSAPSRIVFGWGRRREAGGLARSLGRRAFVVCGSRTLDSTGKLAEILQSLRDAGVEPMRAAMISSEPHVEHVDGCVSFLRQQKAGFGDLLLAIGGGSAIDLAKAAAALVAQQSKSSLRDYLDSAGDGPKISNMPLPVLAMPTTGGTGSEGTKNAVISSRDPPFKKSLRSEMMVPRVVLIDPELSVSVPPNVTAWTGMDAITQLIESCISRRSTPATQDIAVRGLELALPPRTAWGTGLPPGDLALVPVVSAFHDGSSRPAREAMAQAALLSGIALANSGLGMAHGVAAALGIHCNVPHGLACAVMLPAALRANLAVKNAGAQFLRAAIAMLGDRKMRLEPHSIKTIGAAAIELIEALLEELKIPRRLSEIGVTREQIPAIVRDSRGNSMSGNPRELSDDELTRILEDML